MKEYVWLKILMVLMIVLGCVGAANAEVSLGDLEIETHSGVQGIVDSIQGNFEELTPKLDGAAKVILEFS